MKLLFAVYLFSGFSIAPFSQVAAKREITVLDWSILAAIHVPAILLTVLGLWQARKHQRFLGLDLPLFLVVAVVCYGAGVGLGFYGFT